MNGFLSDDDILMCKNVTIKLNDNNEMYYACKLGCELPCEDVLRYSDACKYERAQHDDGWEEEEY